MSAPPPQPLGLEPSFGFGDRIGLATAGHLAAMRAAGEGIAPVFVQQSIREMSRTGRDPQSILASARRPLKDAGWQTPYGADADHLKTTADVERTADAGYTLFTVDPCDHINQASDAKTPDEINNQAAALTDAAPWIEEYTGKRVTLPNDTRLEFDEFSVKLAAVKYAAAINHACALGDCVRSVQDAAGRPYEIGLSINDTGRPTSLVEHYIIAEQCRAAGTGFVNIALRYVGEFERGVDYIGDIAEFEAALQDHAAIAQHLGPYKLGLHSGSDKLAIYPAFAKATAGRFHIKTAGTSYLEALRVASMTEPGLFREICDFSRKHYHDDRVTYRVEALLDRTPPASEVPDDDRLVDLYLEQWDSVPADRGFVEPGRQILHCTYGSVLRDGRLGPALRDCLTQHADIYVEVLTEHFSRHLSALSRSI